MCDPNQSGPKFCSCLKLNSKINIVFLKFVILNCRSVNVQLTITYKVLDVMNIFNSGNLTRLRHLLIKAGLRFHIIVKVL